MNHFVLYACATSWFKIEDESITTIDKEKIFKELMESKEYNIELLGYCQNPKENIVSIDDSEPKKIKIKNDDLCKFKQTASKQSSIYKPIQDKSNEAANIKNKNMTYTLKLIKFCHETLAYSIKEKKFDSLNERDKYLKEIEDPLNYVQFDGDKNCDNIITAYIYKISYEHLFKKPIKIIFHEYFNDDDIIDEEKTNYHLFYPDTKITDLYKYCYEKLPGNPEKLYLKTERMFYDILLKSATYQTIDSFTKKNKPTIVYYGKNLGSYKSSPSKPIQDSKTSSQNQSDTHKTNASSSQSKPIQDSKTSSQNQSDTQETNTLFSQPKPDSNASLYSLPKSSVKGNGDEYNKEKSEPIVIMKYLRNCIHDEKSNLSLIKFTYPDKSKSNGTLYNLHEKLFSDPNQPIISYYIDSNENNFIVKNLETDQLIQNLPPYFNVQIRPHKGLSSRICTLIKSADLSSISNINKDCISFAIKFDHRHKTLRPIYESIVRYICIGIKEIEWEENYNHLKLYFYEKGEFKKIKNFEFVKENELLPIFVIWDDPSVYDFVEGLFKKYTCIM